MWAPATLSASHWTHSPPLLSSPAIRILPVHLSFPFLSFPQPSPSPSSLLVYLPSVHFLRTSLRPCNFRTAEWWMKLRNWPIKTQSTLKHGISQLDYDIWLKFYFSWERGTVFVWGENSRGGTHVWDHLCVTSQTLLPLPKMIQACQSGCLRSWQSKEAKNQKSKIKNLLFTLKIQSWAGWWTPVHQGMCCFANSLIITSIGTM